MHIYTLPIDFLQGIEMKVYKYMDKYYAYDVFRWCDFFSVILILASRFLVAVKTSSVIYLISALSITFIHTYL